MDGGAWCPWGREELDMTEQLHFTSLHFRVVRFIETESRWWFPGTREKGRMEITV